MQISIKQLKYIFRKFICKKLAMLRISQLGNGVFPSQEKEQELEQLTKELRHVNLQQFIQQTGTKVTVLPAQPTGENTIGTKLTY